MRVVNRRRDLVLQKLGFMLGASVAIVLSLIAIIIPIVAWWLLKASAVSWGGHNARVRVLTAGDYATCLVPAALCTIALLGLALYIFCIALRSRR